MSAAIEVRGVSGAFRLDLAAVTLVLLGSGYRLRH